jgi:two-component system, OmpR family, sensor histidine kinase KdpD
VEELVRRWRARLARLGRRELAGAAACLLAIAAATGIVEIVRPHAPVFSLGTLYVLAVLPIAVVWGRTFAIATSLVSMLVFNYVFLPPSLTFTLSGEENWVGLVVFLVTGLVVAELASRARRRATEAEQRRREAALLAELSTVLLSGASVEKELERIAEGAATVLRARYGEIVFDIPERRPGWRWLPLLAGERLIGTLYVPADTPLDEAAAERFLSALASLLAVAIDRERLHHEALEAEALRRSDSMKTALLRSVSHDLRSPLTAIRVGVESLTNPHLMFEPADRENLLETVRAEAERLDRVVGNLLDLSRVQSGAAQPERTLRALDGILVQALNGLDGHERVIVAIPAELPLVEVDAAQIERVLVNLLENALKFSPAGSIVTVSAGSVGGDVVVRVEDEGPGVPHADREVIFEPFRRGPDASDRRGTGLGLAIARGFAEANGGGVLTQPRDGGGSCFILTLPAATVTVGVPA